MISMNYKKIYLILGVILLASVLSGGTFAWLTWATSSSQTSAVTITVGNGFACAVDGGGNITSSDVSLVPTTCTNSTYAIKREIKVMPTIYENLNVALDLWLDINDIGTGLSDSQNFMYALTTNSSSCTDGVISSGNFNGKTTGDTVRLLNNSYAETITETYYLYIWLDSAETSSTTMDQTFSLSLNGNCTNDPYIQPEAPVLDEGMIPVTLSAAGVATTILSSDTSWYNYDNKEWANVVLVDSDSRSTYLNTTGVTVNSDDILA